MFNSGSGFGLDIGALLGNMMAKSGGGSGWGDGNGWWVLIILFALFGGWGGNWGNQRGGSGDSSNGGGSTVSYVPYMMNGMWANGALTRADLCQDMNFQEVQNGIRGIASSMPTLFANLNSTICNQQYDTARMFNSLENVVQNGFNTSNVVALQNQNALQTQIAQCCCDQKSLFAQAEYNRATDTCAITNAIRDAARDIIQNDNCNYRQLHDEQIALQIQGYKERIAQQDSIINGLNLAASQAAQTNSIVNQLRPPVGPAYLVPNPNIPYGGFGFNSGCCNNGWGYGVAC